MMRYRLSIVIPLILILVSFTSSVLVYFVQNVQNKKTIELEAKRHLVREMARLQNILYIHLSEGHEEDALTDLSLVAMTPGIRTLLVTDAEHKVKLSSSHGLKGEHASENSFFADTDATLAILSGVSKLEFNLNDAALLQGYFPLTVTYAQGGLEKKMGVLYVEADIGAVLGEESRESLQQSLLYGAVALVTALFISFILHLMVSKRVKVLSAAARKLEQGDYSVKTLMSGNDELSELGRAFDRMAQSVDENIELREQSARDLSLEQERLAQAQKVGHFGSWELDLTSGKLLWSDEIFSIFEIDKDKFDPSYEAFLHVIHPDDREYVDRAYKESLNSRQPYQITHRLVMEDGRIKWVEERCSSTFDETGNPLRSLGTVQDVTQRELASEQLRIAAVSFDTQEAMIVTDKDNCIIKVNSAFKEITGYTNEEVLGKNPRIFSSGRHDDSFYRAMWSDISQYGRWSGEVWDRRKDGEIYPKWLTITAVKYKGEVTHYVGVFVDITERKRAEEEIHNLAYFDALTKLPNRRLLMDRMGQALAVSARSHHFGALLFLDMDRFKNLNDTLGHGYGDAMLVEVAKRMQSCVRDVDTVARLGGDEFVVLLDEICLDKEEATQRATMIAEKIRLALCQPYQLNDKTFHSSPSIGISLYRGASEPAETLLKQADMAMYQAKEAGRNAVRNFDPEMQHLVEAHAALENDLRHAIAKDQLELYYQLQVDSELRPLGAEALLRWKHPQRGMVSPAQFIPIAEESSLILEIGQWVLETACRQLALWKKDERTRNLILAVNISAQQFRRDDMADQLAMLTRDHGLDPSRLKLELTESVVLSDVTDVVAKMHAIKSLGVRLSLDDFGTGYSSLSYLKQLPLDQIKIDQSFVRDIVSDPNDAVMVQTIIGLGKNFRLNVIAEGVETEAQVNFLKLNGCMAYQGYLFSKPVPLADFEKLLLDPLHV